MSYRIKSWDKSVELSVRRIACEELDSAMASLNQVPNARAVHDLRKRCKKLRGLVRIVRPVFPGYNQENAAFRDIAGLVSTARDAKVMQDICDRLAPLLAGKVDRRVLLSVRRGFNRQRKAGDKAEEMADRIAACRQNIRDARLRAEGWVLDEDGWEALSGGVRKTYRRARKAALAAYAQRTPEAFHDLRKRIKFHGYHAGLLYHLWPDLMAVQAGCAKDISDILGDHHDLAVFAKRLHADPGHFGTKADVKAIQDLARRRCKTLEKRAAPRIERLLAVTCADLDTHWGSLWRTWREPSATPRL